MAPSKDELIARHRRRGRLTYDDNQVLAQPKPGVRIVNEAVLQWARNQGVCEWCGRTRPTVPSHSRSVGAGGDDSFENITALCVECHNRHHQKNDPSLEDLLEIAARRINQG